MWYRLCTDNNIYDEMKVIDPETMPLKPHYRRGFHSVLRQDWKDRIPSILQNGLRIDKGLGQTYGEPNLIWGTTGYNGRYNKTAPTVEFQISPEHLSSAYHPGSRNEDQYDEYWKNSTNYITLTKNIEPEDILAIHAPWHEHLKYALENPDVIEMIKKDPKDFLEKAKAFGEYETYEPIVRYLIANGYI